jgi:exodeoxyribonuclease VII large subunit
LDPLDRRVAALHPARLAEQAAGRLERSRHRLTWALSGRVRRAEQRLAERVARLAAERPEKNLVGARGQLVDKTRRMAWALGGRSKRAGDALAALAGRLTAASPAHRVRLAGQQLTGLARQLESMSHRSVLRRGFSLTRGPDGAILRAVAQVRPGDSLVTELGDGAVRSRATGAWSAAEADGTDVAGDEVAPAGRTEGDPRDAGSGARAPQGDTEDAQDRGAETGHGDDTSPVGPPRRNSARSRKKAPPPGPTLFD